MGDFVKVKVNGKRAMIIEDYRKFYMGHYAGFHFLVRLEDLSAVKMDEVELEEFENAEPCSSTNP